MNPDKRRPGWQISVPCDQLQPIAIACPFENGYPSRCEPSCDDELVILTKELHAANLVEAGEDVVHDRQLSLLRSLEDGDGVASRVLSSRVTIGDVDEVAGELETLVWEEDLCSCKSTSRRWVGWYDGEVRDERRCAVRCRGQPLRRQGAGEFVHCEQEAI